MKNLVGVVKNKQPEKKAEKTEPVEIDDLEKSLVQAIDELGTKDNGTIWKQSSTFAPSNTNNCARYHCYRFNGYNQTVNFTAQTRRIFDLGNRIEDAVGEIFSSMGILLDSQVEIKIEQPPIRGYIDFIIDWNGPKIVECKSINEAGFMYRKMYRKPTDSHYAQIQWYLEAKDWDEGFVFYMNKNTSEILPVLVERNKEFISKLSEKYGKIYKAYEQGIMPERPYKQTSANCKKCDAFDHCWSDSEVGVKIK